MLFEIKTADHTSQEIAEIAKIHAGAIPTGFLSRCPRLLEVLYHHISVDPSCCLLSAVSNGEVVGFIAGTSDSGELYRSFLRKRFVKAVLAVVPHLFSLYSLKRIFETIAYPKKVSGGSMPKAELLSMAVKDVCRRHGVAGALFLAFAAQQKNSGVSSFRIVAGNILQNANKFYLKMGAKKIGEIQVHSGESSQIYRVDLV